MLKEGVNWDDVHLKAHTIATEGLLKLGILQGDKEEILKARTSVAFFPHGLGHYLGMDTHDTGGHPNYQDKDSMFRYLRVRGPLPAGSIITVEPGVSSLPHINLDNADETRVDLFLPVHHRAISPGSGPFWIHQFRSTE
jgi:Xaa-Pro aminopeptidase